MKVTVFEAINFARKELFIGATTLNMNALIAGFHSLSLPETKSWRPADVVEYRSLEFEVDPSEASAFIKRYSSSMNGWDVVTTNRILGS